METKMEKRITVYTNKQSETEINVISKKQSNIATPSVGAETQINKMDNNLHCDICKTDYVNKINYEKHLLTAKHNWKQNGNKMDNIWILKCDICNVKYSTQGNLQKHLDTIKHKKNVFLCNNSENENEDNKCPHCDKNYTSRSGLWKHIQKCNNKMLVKCEIKPEPEEVVKNEIHEINSTSIQQIKKDKMNIITPELVMLLIQQNQEMQQMMVEQNKAMIELARNAGNNHHNTNNTINDNKSFNLNFFLNETCKNAMNLSDFVNGVDISLDDFEETGRIGYVEGLSRVFCKELRKLDISERPIHCSDAKRETIYIRENNRWEKDENKERLLSAVKQIGRKNIKVLTLWQEKYPGYKDVESKENDRYLHILTNIMCGESEEEILSNYGKIMKNISRITVVNKN